MKRLLITLTMMLVAFMANAQSCPDSNHPHAIDLGLPSGTKWACCNVGTKTPEGYGGYYAWGETEEKEIYDWATYIHCDGSKETCHDIGSDIAGTEYDVAHIQWGCSWVMPSQGQIQELASECSYSWETKNGVWGVLFTGPNGDTIFLPAADNSWISHSYSSVSGYNDDSDCEKDEMPISGYYWSSTQSLSGAGFAYNLLFTDNSVFFDYYHHRNVGFTVRPVISGTSNVIHPKSYSDETSQTVYGISGIKVADTTAGMNALPRGIYIRNGRKYVK